MDAAYYRRAGLLGSAAATPMPLYPAVPTAPQPHLGDAATVFAARFGEPAASMTHAYVLLVFDRPTYRLGLVCDELRVVALACTYTVAPPAPALRQDDARTFLPHSLRGRWWTRKTQFMLTEDGWTLAHHTVPVYALREPAARALTGVAHRGGSSPRSLARVR